MESRGALSFLKTSPAARTEIAGFELVRELLLLGPMRRSLLFLVVGLALAFGVNCGSVTSDGSGTGGAGGDAAKGGTGGGGTTGGGGSGGAHATGGSGGNPSTGGTGGAQATGGAGGNPSTGGTGGGSGGHAGAGGTSGTGGSAGQGGHPGTGGGGTGTGGHAGGGGTGSGGHAGAGGTSGTGGSAGQGGHSADGGVTCAELASEYQAAFPAAEACTPATANQCQTLMPLSLNTCSNTCQHYVTDATTLTAIRAQWTDQGCGATPVLCPAIAILCVNPGTAGYCVATDGAAPGGVCGLAVATPALF